MHMDGMTIAALLGGGSVLVLVALIVGGLAIRAVADVGREMDDERESY